MDIEEAKKLLDLCDRYEKHGPDKVSHIYWAFGDVMVAMMFRPKNSPHVLWIYELRERAKLPLSLLSEFGQDDLPEFLECGKLVKGETWAEHQVAIPVLLNNPKEEV